MVPFLLGTLLFLAVVIVLPLKMRVEAQKETGGPLAVRVFLSPWREPFVWEGNGFEAAFALAVRGGEKTRLRPRPVNYAGWLARGLRFWRRLRGISSRLYRAVTCRHWELHLRVGGGEAATTGWLAGSGWLWQAAMRHNLATRVRLATVPRFSVWPSFTEDGLAFKLDCTLGIRLIHIGIAGAGLVAAAWQTLRPTKKL